jgi:hypothetical protein
VTPENQRNFLLGRPVMNCFFCRFIILLALAGLVANCASSAEQLAQRNNERCAARGLQPNTDAFSDCVVALDSQRDQRMESRRRDMMERSAIPGSAIRQ